MRHVLANLLRMISRVFTDRLPQLLILGVVAAAFFFCIRIGSRRIGRLWTPCDRHCCGAHGERSSPQ